MERLELELNAFSRRARSVEVAHTSTALGRGLEPGERVLVRDGEEHLIATVRDISFDLTDTHYRLELGATVTSDDAAMLVAEGPRVWTDRARRRSRPAARGSRTRRAPLPPGERADPVTDPGFTPPPLKDASPLVLSD